MTGRPSRAGFDRCYWVLPGRLLAGSYPGHVNPSKAARKLEALIECGVGLVVNLMEADEVNAFGQRFADYVPLLTAMARDAGRDIRVVRMPIRDFGVPDVEHARAILNTIDEALDAGDTVFVHCWGGKGRTGTVIGCWLARHGRGVGEAALLALNELTYQTPYDFGEVPQTTAQCDFVRAWPAGT